MTDRPRILCIMRIPPFPGGHGGSQRAWLLLNALAKLGPVDFVLVHRPSDRDLDSVSLEPAKVVANTVTVVPIAAWDSIKQRHRWFPWRIARWVDLATIGSAEAPRLPRTALAEIAERLPTKAFDLVFAGRLPSAVIADSLIAHGLLHAPSKVVDFDDVMSRCKRRELDAADGSWLERWLRRLDIALVERAERDVARWDAVALCSDLDVAEMTAALPATRFIRVPNAIDRPLLPPPPPSGAPSLLFVGNLGFPPNEHGLRRFLAEAWPRIQAANPHARLVVVGMRPSAAVRALTAEAGVALHADVPDVAPFYRDCTAVICPIFFGGGTRVKLLEAMAYGRAIVSTTIGAEGLDLVPNEHALIADDMEAFAAAALRLLDDRGLAERLAMNARTLQQRAYAPPAIEAGIVALVRVALQDRIP